MSSEQNDDTHEARSAQRIGEVVTSLVIARPHNDINKIVIKHKA